MDEINWNKIWLTLHKEIVLKLKNLPNHENAPKDLKKLHHLISHELPETSSIKIFRLLIGFLSEGKTINLSEIKRRYLNPELEKEKKILDKSKKDFKELKKSAGKWVKMNLPEEKLEKLWEKRQTWLPRRYVLYKKKVSLQKITTDTLARFVLIKNL